MVVANVYMYMFFVLFCLMRSIDLAFCLSTISGLRKNSGLHCKVVTLSRAVYKLYIRGPELKRASWQTGFSFRLCSLNGHFGVNIWIDSYCCSCLSFLVPLVFICGDDEGKFGVECGRCNSTNMKLLLSAIVAITLCRC
jgi:hypothetical protein